MEGSQLLGYARPIDLAATKTTTRSRWSLKQPCMAPTNSRIACWPFVTE